MLAHQPRSFDESIKYHADLTLAGHTHGGQFWPLSMIADLLNIYSYLRGLYEFGEQKTFVSCGTGYRGIPLRIGVPPEICLHILKHK